MNASNNRLLPILIMVFSVFAIFLPSSALAEEGSEPVLVDEVDTDNCEALLSRLDSFSAQLHQTGSKGFVLFSTTNDRVRDNFLYRFVRYHRTNSLRDEPRFEVIPVAGSGKPRFEMWVGSAPEKIKARRIDIGYDLDLAGKNRIVFFFSDLYEPFVENGRRTFTEVSAACTTRPWNPGLLSTFLDKDVGSKAYFVIRGTPQRFAQFRTFFLRETYNKVLDRAKIRFIYAGSRMINSTKFVEVEVFVSRTEIKSASAFPYNLSTY